jgi:glycosyltransferase involved in cell wall biosynthesis
VKKRLPNAKIIIDSVDLHFARELQMAEVHKDEEMRRKAYKTMEIELDIYKRADCVWAVTTDDRSIVNKYDSKIITDLITLILPVEEIDRRNMEKNTLLFIGNYWHQPNVDAVLYFCKDIFPMVLTRIPDVIFKIVGNAPTPEIKNLESNNIQVIGWVPDTKPYLEKCHISVVPLRYGAGMKGKVVETMSVGVPVVTTSIGIQGIDVKDGEHILKADNPQTFSNAIVKLLTDDELAVRLSYNSKKYVHEFLSPEVVEKNVLASIKKVLF